MDFKVSRNNKIVIMNFLPNAGSIKLTETGIKEIIGRIYYLI
jgi:hypothetical protein